MAGPTLYLTRTFDFNAAHRIHNPRLSDARNAELYGKCNNPAGHGHNYHLEVTVAGQPDPESQYVMDLGVLKAIVQRHVIDVLDHRHLNVDVPYFQECVPSAENIAVFIWDAIAPHIAPATLHRVKLYETPKNIVEYYGPNGRA